MSEHIHNIRVYYEDTDAGGVAYHANYLNFAERARTEWLRTLGHQNSTLAKDLGFIFVVKHAEVDYIRPARLDDALQMRTSILTMKNSSFTMHQCLYRDEEMLADIKIALVCVDTTALKPVRLPDILRDEFAKFLETQDD